MGKKRLIAAIVAVVVAGVAYVGGMVASDPTDSTEYKTLAAELLDREAELSETEEVLESNQNDLSDVETQLSEAQLQVDALTSQAHETDGEGSEPAVSGEAAVAPRNFKLGLRTRSKQCFGSAGCNVTVQVRPSYVGTQDVSSGSWEITYEVRGGEDGPQVETMTLENGTFSFPEEQSLSTTSSSVRLEAVVTEVYALD